MLTLKSVFFLSTLEKKNSLRVLSHKLFRLDIILLDFDNYGSKESMETMEVSLILKIDTKYGMLFPLEFMLLKNIYL